MGMVKGNSFSFILGYRKLNLVVKNRNEETKRDMHGEDCNVKLYNNFKFKHSGISGCKRHFR